MKTLQMLLKSAEVRKAAALEAQNEITVLYSDHSQS